MTEAYWKQRCEAAEDALRRARTRLQVSAVRRDVLGLLAGLHVGQELTTAEIAAGVGKSEKTILVALSKLHAAGFVDRSEGHAYVGHPVRWKLGHMVCVEEVPCKP